MITSSARSQDRSAQHRGAAKALLPNGSKQPGLIHLVFTTKRGLAPAVRALIDHLVNGFKEEDATDSPCAVRVRVCAKGRRPVPSL
jgi:hypothetical protein